MAQTDMLLHVGPARFTKAGYIKFGRYESGELAIVIMGFDEQPQGKATVSLMPYGAPHPGDFGVWLKGWSENEGIPAALEKAGIVRLTDDRFPTGFVEAVRAELTDKARAALARVQA